MGYAFDIQDFDSSNALAVCGVVLTPQDKEAAYAAGQLEYFITRLGPVSLPACDLTTLSNSAFALASLQCNATAAQGVCGPECSTAVATAGDACIQALGYETVTSNPTLYNAYLKQFEPCGFNPLAPAPAPVIAPAPLMAPPFPPPPSPPFAVPSPPAVPVPPSGAYTPYGASLSTGVVSVVLTASSLLLLAML